MDPLAALLLTLGIILLTCSWILLLIVSSQEDFSWVLFSVLCPPLSYIFGLFVWSKAKEAILVAALGWLMIILQIAA